MTREVMDKAVDPFFTTKPAGVGTGLGLSQVYGFTTKPNVFPMSQLGQLQTFPD